MSSGPSQPIQSRPATAQVPRNPEDYEFTDPQLANDYRKLYEQFTKVQGRDFGLGVSDRTTRSNTSCGPKVGEVQEDEKCSDNMAYVM